MRGTAGGSIPYSAVRLLLEKRIMYAGQPVCGLFLIAFSYGMRYTKVVIKITKHRMIEGMFHRRRGEKGRICPLSGRFVSVRLPQTWFAQ